MKKSISINAAASLKVTPEMIAAVVAHPSGGAKGVPKGARLVPFLLAKNLVQGVLWNQLCDSGLHEFPNGGLFDDRRQAKTALDTLASIRHTHLK